MTTEQLIQKFTKIEKSQKLIRLKEMLGILKDGLPIFEDINMHLKNIWNDIQEDTLIMYYSTILKNAEYLENKKVTQYQEFMSKLREREEQEHIRDEKNLDDQLNNI